GRSSAPATSGALFSAGAIGTIRPTIRPEARMHDLRLAVRSLICTPILTVVAVASLALGIGANTAIFSLVNGLVLRELSIAGGARLVTITTTNAVAKNWRWTWNYPVWNQIRQRSALFDGTLAFAFDRFNTSTSGEAQFVDGLWVDSGLFSTAGIAP